MDCFCRFLESHEKSILFIHGPSGSGKSSLLAKMIHECSLREVLRARLEWTDTKSHDYLAVMRSIRDDLGAPSFERFTALINAYFDPSLKLELTLNATGKISVAEGLRARDADIGDIAGVMVRDCMFVVPRTDLGVSESERMTRLTDAFIADLVVLNTSRNVVLFFDAVQKMTEETRVWMWGEFMPAIRDERLSNTFAVHFGWREPELDRDTRLATWCAALGPLGQSDIEDYLKRRGVSCSAPGELAKMVLAGTKGWPISVANLVDSYLGQA
jgi:hypothetical protein